MDGWNEDDVLQPEGGQFSFSDQNSGAFNPFRPVSAADHFQRQAQQARQENNELIPADPGQMYGQPWTAPLSPPQPLSQPHQPVYDSPGSADSGRMLSSWSGSYTGGFQPSGGYPRIDDDPMPYPAGGFAIGGQPLPGPGGYQAFPPMFTAPVQPTGYEQPYPQQPYPAQPEPQGVSTWSGPMQPVQGNPADNYAMQNPDPRYTGGYPVQQPPQPGYGAPYGEPPQADPAPQAAEAPPSPWDLPKYPEDDSDWQPNSEDLKAAELYRAQQEQLEQESNSKSKPGDLNIPSYLKGAAKLRKPPALAPLKSAEAADEEAAPPEEAPADKPVQPEDEWFTNAAYQRPRQVDSNAGEEATEAIRQAAPTAGEDTAEATQRVVLPPSRRSRRSRQAGDETDVPVIQTPVSPARPEPPEDTPPGGDMPRRRRSRHGAGEAASAQESAAGSSGDASSSDAGECLPFVNQAGAKDTGVNPGSVRPVPACNPTTTPDGAPEETAGAAAPARPSPLRRPMLIHRSTAAYRVDPEDAEDPQPAAATTSARQDDDSSEPAIGVFSGGLPFGNAPAADTPVQPAPGEAPAIGGFFPLAEDGNDSGDSWQPFGGVPFGNAPAADTPVQPAPGEAPAIGGFFPLAEDGNDSGDSWQPFGGVPFGNAPIADTPVQPAPGEAPAIGGFFPLAEDGNDSGDSWQPFGSKAAPNTESESAGSPGGFSPGSNAFPGGPLFSGFSPLGDDDSGGSWQPFGHQASPPGNPLFPQFSEAAAPDPFFSIPDLPEPPGTVDMPLNDEALNELFNAEAGGTAERPFGISSYDAGDMPNPTRGHLPYDVVSAFDTSSNRRSIELIDATGGLKPEPAPEAAPAPEEAVIPQAPAPFPLPQKDPGKPPIKVSRLILLVVAAIMLLFCIAAGGRILIAYVQNTDEMANLSDNFYGATGMQLNEAGETVQLNQDGTTFPPDGHTGSSIFYSLTAQTGDGSGSQNAQTAANGSKRTRLSEYPLDQRFTIIETIGKMQNGDPEEDRPAYPNVSGQLTIPGLLQEWVVDGKDSTYYINHNYRNTQDYYGAVYVEQSCTLETPPENLHLRGSDAISDTGSEAVFSKLWQYKTGGSTFTMAHNTAHLILPHEELDFELFAVIEASSDPKNPKYFNYFSQPSFQSDEAMMNYVANARRHSIYTLPAEVQPGHRLLTVSTVSFSGDTSLVLLFRSNRLYSDEYIAN